MTDIGEWQKAVEGGEKKPNNMKVHYFWHCLSDHPASIALSLNTTTNYLQILQIFRLYTWSDQPDLCYPEGTSENMENASNLFVLVKFSDDGVVIVQDSTTAMRRGNSVLLGCSELVLGSRLLCQRSPTGTSAYCGNVWRDSLGWTTAWPINTVY